MVAMATAPDVNATATVMPPSFGVMKPPTEQVVAAENMKIRSVIDSVANDWLCPLTHELPFDPVTAEDGHIYERAAIEELLKKQGNSLKSPMTGKRMGPQLTSSVQARNTIQKLVRSGVITGPKAEPWRQRIMQEEERSKMIARAEGGDRDAMYQLGNWYFSGGKGLTKDTAQAIKWFREGARSGDASAMYSLAVGLYKGVGCEQNKAHGIGLIFRAAEMGSAAAAFDLGEAFDEGTIGLPQDKWEARYWYGRVAHATFDELSTEQCQKAAERSRMPGTAAPASDASFMNGDKPLDVDVM